MGVDVKVNKIWHFELSFRAKIRYSLLVMKLFFFLGKSLDLAKKEIEAAATILPFSYSTKILSADVLMLKSDSDFELLDGGLFGSQSKELMDFFQKVLLLQNKLGGTVKIGLCLTELSGAGDFDQIEAEIEKQLSIIGVDGGKLSFGISTSGEWVGLRREHKYDLSKKIADIGFNLKKKLGQKGVNVRYLFLDRGTKALSSAQVFHNKLALITKDGLLRKKGVEILLIPAEDTVYLGVTLTVQNIESYSFRDFQIPKPDPVSGMLPPKLAQMMINLADSPVIYDPFCGNGRVMMEGSLMGKTCYGSDIVAKKVTSSRENLIWLRRKFRIGEYDGMQELVDKSVWEADATSPESVALFKEVIGTDLTDVSIVAEPYLGRPLSKALGESEIEGWLTELVKLYGSFLETWSDAGVSNMVVVFPRVKVLGGSGSKGAGAVVEAPVKTVSVFENLIDKAALLGYDSTVLGCYERPDSFVIREIVKINKI